MSGRSATRAHTSAPAGERAGAPSTNGRIAWRLGARASVGALLRAVPRAGWVCALVACLNAACWSIVTPAFQPPDEPAHFAYVKQIAETGTLPTSDTELTSGEEIAALAALRFYALREEPQDRAIASRAEEEALNRRLATTPRDEGSAGAGTATSEPPLYYALEAVPYDIASGASVLDRLTLMRLASALFAGITALFVFLFVREALPAEQWAWTVAGLSVAFAPLLGFMSGAVNPDSMLCAVSAAIFYCLARAFARGLTAGGAAAIGALTAIGLLTKLNFIGLLPGVLLGVIVLGVRATRTSGRVPRVALALAFGIALSPAVLYAAINMLSNHPTLGFLSSTIDTTHGSLLAQLNYVWQLYLPRLPGTFDYFPGIQSTRQLWFNGYVGLYGWFDTTFPAWVTNVALIPAGALALLCGRSLVRSQAQLRSRAGELAVYAAITIGLLMLVGLDGYRNTPATITEYAQPRYLLPLIALLGAALAMAARGAGRRWGPSVGVLIVVLFLAHDIFSQLLEAGRFYG